MDDQGKRRLNASMTTVLLLMSILSLSVLYWIPGKVSANPPFEASVKVDPMGSTYYYQYNADIAVDKNDVIYLVWTDYRNDNGDIFFSKSTDGGVSFGPCVRVDDTGISYSEQDEPRISVDSNGIIYVVWSDYRKGDQDIYFAKSTNGGASFAPNVRVDDTQMSGSYQYSPDIAVDQVGNIYIVWEDDRNSYGPDIFFSKSVDGGLSFLPNVRVDDTATDYVDQAAPSIAVDDDGNIYAIWADHRDNRWNIFFSKSIDGGLSFGPNIRVDDTGTSSSITYQNDIAVDKNGNIYVVWADDRDLQYYHKIYSARSVDGGVAFEPSVRVDDSPTIAYYQNAPRMAVDNDGNIHVVWEDYRDGSPTIYYSKSIDEGTSFGANQRVDDNGPNSYYPYLPRVATNSKGDAYVTWYDSRDTGYDTIYFSRTSFVLTSPVVTSTSPINGGGNVPTDSDIIISFSKTMNRTATETAVSSNPPISGTYSWDGQSKELTLTPTGALSKSTSYIISISTSAKSQTGLQMLSPYTFSFATGSGGPAPPKVTRTVPLIGTMSVPLDSEISIFFDRAMNRSATEGAMNISPSISWSNAWSSGDKVLTILPTSLFEIDTNYTINITTAAKSKAGANMESQYTSWFVSASGPPIPRVLMAYPCDGSTNVPITTKIIMKFSEPMNETQTEGAITFFPSEGGTYSWDIVSKNLTWTPDTNLSPETDYTMVISTDATSKEGANLWNGFSISFRTGDADVTPPTVLATSPNNNSINVPVNTNLSINFSRSMITYTTEMSMSSNYDIGGIFNWDAYPMNVTWDHSMPLLSGTKYIVNISTLATSQGGIHLQSPYSFNFITSGPAQASPAVLNTTPSNGAPNVTVNSNVFINFSQSMNRYATESAISFYPWISGWYNWDTDNRHLEYYVSPSMPYSTNYTVNVSTVAKSRAGLNMQAPYSFVFRTSDPPRPKITGTNPVNNSINVPITSSITVYFSESMDTPSVMSAFSTFPPITGSYSWFSSYKTMTLYPSSNLQYSKNYTIFLNGTARSQMGAYLEKSYWFRFTTVNPPPAPVVVGTSPVNGTTNVSVFSSISITFSEAMNTAATQGAISSSPSISGSFSWNGIYKTVTWYPSPRLQYSTTYKVTVSTAARSQIGINMKSLFWFNFTTANPPAPSITSTYPLNNTNNVPINVNISINFSESMDPSTTENAISATPPFNRSFLWYNGYKNLLWNPSTDLQMNTSYTIRITTAAKSQVGGYLQKNYSFNFITVVSMPLPPKVLSSTPADSSTNVPVGINLIFYFSEAMDKPSAQGALQSQPSISGSFSWDLQSRNMTVNPSTDLQFGTYYLVNITAAAKSQAGVNMQSNYQIKFWTENAPPPAPKVISTSPANNSVNVSIYTNITITFSESMNRSVTESAITSSPSFNGTFVWNGASKVVIWYPEKPLNPNSQYWIDVANKAMSQAGVKMKTDHMFRFTTGSGGTPSPPIISSTSPADGSIDAPRNSSIDIIFNKPMMTAETLYAISISPNINWTAIWSDGDTKVSLRPIELLKWKTKYSVIISTMARSKDGAYMASPYAFSFTTEADTTPPFLEYIIPNNGQTDVPIDTDIHLHWSEYMDQASVRSAFSSSPPISCIWSGDLENQTCTPQQALDIETIYSITISTVARDINGNKILSPYLFAFETMNASKAPPRIMNVFPTNGSKDVALDTNILILWNKEMDQFSAESAFISSPTIECSWAWTLSLQYCIPIVPLKVNTEYVLTISTDAKDSNSTPLAESFSFSFKTLLERPCVTSVKPADGSRNISLGENIVITFDRPMNVTVTSTVVVSSPSIDWTSVWSGQDTVLTLTPTKPLRGGTTYTVIVLTSAKSAEGGYLSSNYQFSFTTISVISPPSEDLTPIVAVVGAVIALVLVGAVMSIEWILFAAILFVSPLYKRFKKEQIEDYLARGNVQRFIEDNPGSHLRAIKLGLTLPIGVICHHLRVLEKEKLVVVRKEGRLKKFYAIPRILGKSVLQPTGSQKKMLATLSDHPGISAIALSKYLGIDESTVTKNLKILGETGKIRARQTSRGTRYYVSKKKEPQN